MTKIDLYQLTQEIRSMKTYHKLYKVLKQELSAKNHWRNHPRGNPSKGGNARKRQQGNFE